MTVKDVIENNNDQVLGLHNFKNVELKGNKEAHNFGSLKKNKLEKKVHCIDEKQTNDDEEEESSSLNPLLMHDTLYYIFRCMDVNSLKVCRGVCKLWEEEAFKEILKQEFCLTVPDRFHKKKKDEQENYIKNLKSFLSTKNITIKSIIIQKKKDIPVLQSLNIFEQVKELKLDLFCKFENFEDFIKNDLVNLKYLTWTNEEVAEDLECLSNFIVVIQVLTSIKKPSLTVSQLSFHPVHTFDNEIVHLTAYDEILKLKVITKKLFINLMHVPNHPEQLSRVSKQLENILIASRDILEEIILLDPLGFLPGFKMPILPKVSKFHLRLFIDSIELDEYYRNGLLFPSGFKFNTHLPNLVEFKMYSSGYDTKNMSGPFDIWAKSFESTGCASKVKNVIYNVSTDFDRSSLTSTFPCAKIQEWKRVK